MRARNRLLRLVHAEIDDAQRVVRERAAEEGELLPPGTGVEAAKFLVPSLRDCGPALGRERSPPRPPLGSPRQRAPPSPPSPGASEGARRGLRVA